MASRPETLPEGTDSVVAGAFDPDTSDQGADTRIEAEEPAATDDGPASRFGEQAANLKGQAADKAREYALMGKDRATDALDSFSRAVLDAARTVDDRIGSEYGDYARRAADAVSGLSTTLREKEVDELYDDARNIVRNSPAVAIGVAAAFGFAMVRLIKSGAGASEGEASSSPASTASADDAGSASPGRGSSKSSSKKGAKTA